MRRAWALLCCAACNNPLSNDVFYADDAFLAALPDADRVGFSTTLTRIPREGDDPLLAAVIEEAERIEPALTFIISITGVFSTTDPSERSGTLRHWDPRAVSTPPGFTEDLWYLRADIVRSSPTSDFTWIIEGSMSDSGPWTPLASGEHDPDDKGDFDWNLEAAGEVLNQHNLFGTISASYSGSREDRETDINYDIGMLTPLQYGFAGTSTFGWVGEVNLGERQPGAGQVYLEPTGAGEAIVVIYPDGVEAIQQSCWNVGGITQHAMGSALEDQGIATMCVPGGIF